jgi:hypothetical protein
MNGNVEGKVSGRELRMKSIVKTVEELPRSRVRCKEEFTADELALLQAKLEGWLRAVAVKSDHKRPRQQFVIKFRNSGRA